MDLKEFTKQTLLQIVEGAHEANNALASSSARVLIEAPRHAKKYIYNSSDVAINVIDVDFDVAITATETEGANGGGGIKVMGVFNAGGEIESRTENQTVSRVKYTIPLVLGSKN